MKNPSEYQALANLIKERCEQIAETAFAATEPHLSKKISDKSGVVLAITIPPANSGSLNEDNLSDRSRIILFLLEKFDSSNSDSEELTHWDKMANITKEVRRVLLDLQFEGHELLTEFREQGMRTEPEYQLFGKYNGYSIGFESKDYEW